MPYYPCFFVMYVKCYQTGQVWSLKLTSADYTQTKVFKILVFSRLST
jgi:hypothetical protein